MSNYLQTKLQLSSIRVQEGKTVLHFEIEADRNSQLRHNGKVYYEINHAQEKRQVHRGSFNAELNKLCTIFLDDKLWFGKYNYYTGCDLTVKQICEREPAYVQNLFNEKIVQLSEEVIRYVHQKLFEAK